MNYKNFTTIEKVNDTLKVWSIAPRLVNKNGVTVVTLVLMYEKCATEESQSLDYLLDYIVQIEGTRWANLRGLYS